MKTENGLPLLDAESAKELAREIIMRVEGGALSPLHLKAQIKRLQDVLEQVDKMTKQDQVSALEKYGKEKPVIGGYRFEMMEAGTRYDYSSCGDLLWHDLNNMAQSLSNKKSEREKFLKALTTSLTEINEETGEIITLNPPVKTSTTTIRITDAN